LATIRVLYGDYTLNWRLFRRLTVADARFGVPRGISCAAIAPLDAQVPAAYNAAMRKEFAIIQRITDPAP